MANGIHKNNYLKMFPILLAHYASTLFALVHFALFSYAFIIRKWFSGCIRYQICSAFTWRSLFTKYVSVFPLIISQCPFAHSVLYFYPFFIQKNVPWNLPKIWRLVFAVSLYRQFPLHRLSFFHFLIHCWLGFLFVIYFIEKNKKFTCQQLNRKKWKKMQLINTFNDNHLGKGKISWINL